ncbi:T9SS type A sorting domain-containing protein [Flavobacterium sp.]|uniref:T9SS type A sorting domain-containing protein n=1 Tax=Flavobacterium sp. TaxID=239 RepID=UPI002634B24F|nr:T9SS type A sorting domain-containing protein [Flavobacterium sp.]
MKKLITFCFLLTSLISNSQTIDAVNDNNFVPINYVTGGTTVSVLNNDTMNNNTIIPSLISINAIQIPIGLTLNADGTVTVDSNLAIGSYSLTYQICITNTPTICDTAIATINIVSSSFSIQNDFFNNIDGLYGQTTTVSILNNDTYNGSAINLNNFTVVPLLNPNSIIGLTFNPNGTLTIAPQTPQGTYYANYKIYENANPSNFAIASITIQVPYVNLDIIGDGPFYINGITGGSTPSVFLNDTINGNPLLGNQVNTTLPIQAPGQNSFATINANGIITIAPNAPSGTYYIGYQTCLTYDAVCDQDSVLINIINGNIFAENDSITHENSPTNNTTPSIFNNDFINNTIPNSNNVIVTAINLPNGFTLNSNGTISIALGTPVGTYNFSYQICEVGNPNNCSSAALQINLTSNIVANADTINYQNGITTPISESLLTNDTLNGQPATQNNVTITAINIPAGFTLNADGTFNVALGTLSGNYTILYKIAENGYPTNFATATATIVLTNAIEAIVDDINYLNAPNNSPASSVIYNDLLNGNYIDPYGNIVTITPINFPTGFSLDAYGNIYVALGTPAGNYTFSYQICEINNPNNCAVGTVNFNLTSNIVAVQDQINFLSPNGGTTSDSVLDNDTLNTIPAIYTLNDILLSGINVPQGIVLNIDGTITIPNNFTYGNYNFDYQLCESNYTTNCATTNVSLVIVSPFAPTGPLTQNIPQSGTLAGLQVTGQNIQWYSAATNKSSNALLSSAIPSSTPVVVGATYYATQTVNGIESITRLPVTISGLSTNNYTFNNLNYYPNPVKNSLSISNTSLIEEIEITSLLRQRILTKKINELQTELDLSELAKGVYFLKIISEGQEKTIKIIKE